MSTQTQITRTPETRAIETFTLYYLHGGNHHVKQKNFNFSGRKEEAIARGKAHCEVMGYRFVRVEPFFSVLENDEKFHREDP